MTMLQYELGTWYDAKIVVLLCALAFVNTEMVKTCLMILKDTGHTSWAYWV
jgi:hypothetical protein